MPIEVRKAIETDARGVYELLRGSTLNNASLPFSARERLFRPVWGGEGGHYGYLLEDQGEVVGFLGTLFTEREVGGERHKFCELHSWYVREEHRTESMRLFFSAMSAKRVTFLNYTPSQAVYDISKKFGYQDLETHLLLIHPAAQASGVGAEATYQTTSDKHVIADQLDGADRRILKDHEDLDCEHLLVRRKDASGLLYVILKKMWWDQSVPLGRVLYFNDEDMLAEALDELKDVWCRHFGLDYLMIDRDLLQAPERLPSTTVRERPIPSIFKSKTLTAEDLRVPLYNEPLLVGYRLH